MLSLKVIAVGAAGVLALSGCKLLTGGSVDSTLVDDSVQTTDEALAPQEAIGVEGDPSGGEVMVDGAEADLVIDMSNFEFSMDEITASAGDVLTIKLTNSQGTHNFVIDELEVESDTIQAGEETMVTVEIPETASGESYAFYCSIGNHRALGMEGVINVL